MKTAEDWSRELSTCRLEDQPMIVRQIQADALRWAAEELQGPFYPNMAQRFIAKANELDPQKLKPTQLENT